LTFLLTFRCYGSWLPGDARGWVDRSRGDHRGGYKNPSIALTRRSRQEMTDSPYRLDRSSAQIVLRAIHEVCGFRVWPLIAAHVRATHVHCIVADVTDPESGHHRFQSLCQPGIEPNRRTAKKMGTGGQHAAASNE